MLNTNKISTMESKVLKKLEQLSSQQSGKTSPIILNIKKLQSDLGVYGDSDKFRESLQKMIDNNVEQNLSCEYNAKWDDQYNLMLEPNNTQAHD